MSNPRIVTGILERHPPLLFLKSDAGHRWRLEVDEQRVTGLIGLRVRVKGRSKEGTISVEGTFPDNTD